VVAKYCFSAWNYVEHLLCTTKSFELKRQFRRIPSSVFLSCSHTFQNSDLVTPKAPAYRFSQAFGYKLTQGPFTPFLFRHYWHLLFDKKKTESKVHSSAELTLFFSIPRIVRDRTLAELKRIVYPLLLASNLHSPLRIKVEQVKERESPQFFIRTLLLNAWYNISFAKICLFVPLITRIVVRFKEITKMRREL